MVTTLAAMLDRERDEAFRGHLRDKHGFATNHMTGETVLLVAKREGAYCETCKRYAESAGTEE